MAKYLVTGGTGFIGHNLTRHLVSLGHEVIITGSPTELKIPNVTTLECHLTGIDFERIGKIDGCFHQAGNNQTTSLDKQEMMAANFYAAKTLFEKLFHDHGCKKIVYASSASIYGNGLTPYKETNTPNPLSYYAESKLAFDEWVQVQKFDCIGLRYSNVYGPFEHHKKDRASMISKIIHDMQNNKPIKLFKYGEQKRDWIFVDDCTEANLYFMNTNYKGIINCGSGEQTSFNEIVGICENKIGIKTKIEYIDCKMNQEYQACNHLCMEKSKSLGFLPKTSVHQGIEFILETEKTCLDNKNCNQMNQ